MSNLGPGTTCEATHPGFAVLAVTVVQGDRGLESGEPKSVNSRHRQTARNAGNGPATLPAVLVRQGFVKALGVETQLGRPFSKEVCAGVPCITLCGGWVGVEGWCVCVCVCVWWWWWWWWWGGGGASHVCRVLSMPCLFADTGQAYPCCTRHRRIDTQLAHAAILPVRPSSRWPGKTSTGCPPP